MLLFSSYAAERESQSLNFSDLGYFWFFNSTGRKLHKFLLTCVIFCISCNLPHSASSSKLLACAYAHVLNNVHDVLLKDILP